MKCHKTNFAKTDNGNLFGQFESAIAVVFLIPLVLIYT